jgi:hypothetical protein
MTHDHLKRKDEDQINNTSYVKKSDMAMTIVEATFHHTFPTKKQIIT